MMTWVSGAMVCSRVAKSDWVNAGCARPRGRVGQSCSRRKMIRPVRTHVSHRGGAKGGKWPRLEEGERNAQNLSQAQCEAARETAD